MRTSVLFFTLVQIFSSTTLVSAQNNVNPDLQELLFNDEEETNPQEQDDQPKTCECMPFYQCNENNTINEYGENVIDIRFGESNCPHYLDTCCNIPSDNSLPPPPHPTPTPHIHTSCGLRHPEGVGFRITGGSDNEANYGEFPWMVALLKDDLMSDKGRRVMECGGSIIHPRVVLTGAHCVKGRKNLSVLAGEWDTQTDKELYTIQEVFVHKVIIHEQYYPGGLHNDIALLVLESPLVLNDVVDTICLPEEKENVDGRNCVVSGWGKDAYGIEGKNQVILKRVELPIVPRNPCQAALRKTKVGANFKLHPSFICAGGLIGKDACKGDGGGPLVCPMLSDSSKYVQAGIVSWGVGCGNATPAVYTNVAYLRPWIDKQLASLNIS